MEEEARLVKPGARRGEPGCDEQGHACHHHALTAAGVGGYGSPRLNDGDPHGMDRLATETFHPRSRPCHDDD